MFRQYFSNISAGNGGRVKRTWQYVMDNCHSSVTSRHTRRLHFNQKLCSSLNISSIYGRKKCSIAIINIINTVQEILRTFEGFAVLCFGLRKIWKATFN